MGSARFGITPGERLFLRYLEEHGIPYDYHPTLDGARKHPDVVLGNGARRVLCEVADFGEGEQDKPILAGLRATREEHESGIATATWVGALSFPDILQRIRSKVIDELTQLGEFRDRYSLIVVLHNAASLSTKLDDHIVLCAMCGLLTPELYTQMSAVVVVTSVRPGSKVEKRVLRGLRKDEGRHRRSGWRRPSRGELARGFEVLVKEKQDWGGALDVDRRVPPSVFPAPFASTSEG